MRKLNFLWVLLLAVPLCAQEAPKGEEGRRPAGPPPEPKNLQVLKVKGPELIAVMRSFNAALGFRCDKCHVQGDFASDDKHEKVVARKMLEMTHDINARFPNAGDGERMRVTCYTCHRGEEHPKTVPPEAAAAPGQERPH